METKKQIVFKTRVTPKLAAISCLPLAAAGALGYFALDAGAKFHASDPSRYLFVGIPAVIAVVLVLSVLLIFNHFLGRTMILTSDTLEYRDPKCQIMLEIAEMAYSPPNEDAALKTLMFSDGNVFIQIPELFMGEKDFKKFNKFIKKTRTMAETSGSQKTWTL